MLLPASQQCDAGYPLQRTRVHEVSPQGFETCDLARIGLISRGMGVALC